MVVLDFLEKASRLYPQKEAIICGDTRLTYKGFFKRTIRLARVLRRCGVKSGEVVSILHHNCHYYLEAYYAAAWCGAILNSINTRLTSGEVGYILQDADSKLLITHPRYAALVNALRSRISTLIWTGPDVSPDLEGVSYEEAIAGEEERLHFAAPHQTDQQIAHLYYTSGTTGRPKGVPLTHKNVTSHALCAIAEFGLTDRDNWLHAAPLFHLADAWATFALTAVGATHTILGQFGVEQVCELIGREKVTITNMIPTMLTLLVNFERITAYDFSSLRVLLSGGAPIAPELVRKILSTFKCDYIQTYGMTETSPYLTVSTLKDHLRTLPFEEQLSYKAKTGREFLGVSLRVVNENGSEVKADGREVGEIIVKGDNVTPGYWKLPEETNATIRDGWLYTGDLATIDAEGYVNIVDRKKDMIITGGENVYSTEVEHVIYEHPAVLEATVIGVPDEKWGEAIKALVVLKEKARTTEQEIISFVKARIAPFKAPKVVAFLQQLPKTGSGKISKKALRELHQS
jgi:acyl-CoA synthetase (AMP-forming)/AMP-acid ligase II